MQFNVRLKKTKPRAEPDLGKRPKRILVVDDEENARIGLSRLLSNEGFLIDCVSNGFEALNYLRQQEVDLIISDINMPEMNGITFLKELNKSFPKSNVIIITAYGAPKWPGQKQKREGARTTPAGQAQSGNRRESSDLQEMGDCGFRSKNRRGTARPLMLRQAEAKKFHSIAVLWLFPGFRRAQEPVRGPLRIR